MGKTIMVVDDEADIRDTVKTVLEKEGYTVVTANNADDALKKEATAKPALILMDIMMPGIDGFETCRRLKENDAMKAIPVIFISAKVEREDIEKIYSVGGVDYINKPFQREEVLSRVQTHLELIKTKREKKALIEQCKDN